MSNTTNNQRIVAGAAGGSHVAGAPLTTTATRIASPELLVNSIDRHIVKINPSSTPVDQISRVAGTRRAGAMVVQYYSVDTKSTESEVEVAINVYKSLENDEFEGVMELSVKDATIFDKSETVLVPSVLDGEGQPLVLYVADVLDDHRLKVVAVNEISATKKMRQALAEKGAKVIRMGRAAGELDVQTAQFQALPKKATNYCQIFKAQIEQSTLQKLADKEVGWTLTDQEESAIMDMRAGMEKSFLFGVKRRIVDPVKGDEIFLTGGIWHQAAKKAEYTIGKLNHEKVMEICASAFTGSNGSRRKLLLAGTELVRQLSNITVQKVALLGQTTARWGIEAREIVTNFGRLYLVHSETFDQCGHSADGLIIDPAYISKYSHIPFNAEKLNLRSSGTRNSDAIVLTEASCLVLRYPEAHVRVTGVAGEAA